MLFQVVLSLSLVVVALGDGCCAPKRWEGLEMAAGGYTTKTGRKGGIHSGFRISYDAESQKVAVSGRSMREKAKVKLIYDFQMKKAHLIFPEKNECKSFELKKRFREACIPDDSEVLGSSFIGAGENSLDVTAYKIMFNGKRAHVTGVATVTKEGCVPISEDWWGDYNGAGFFTNVNFAGITPGIEDPTVFSPPDYCQETTGEMLEEEYDSLPGLRVSSLSLLEF